MEDLTFTVEDILRQQKLHWTIVIGDKSFFSVTSVPMPIFGDSPGQFTYEEMDILNKEFDKYESLFPLNQEGARALKEKCISKLK